MIAQSYCAIGNSARKIGNWPEALKNLEEYYKSSKTKLHWKIENSIDNETLHSDACVCQVDVYNQLAASAKDHETSLEYYLKAYKLAKESGVQSVLTDVKLLLALSYERNRQSEKAIHFLDMYLKDCQAAHYSTGMAKAYHALSESYQSIGELEKSLHYCLAQMDVAKKSSDVIAEIRGFQDISILYNRFGNYAKAVEYSVQAYAGARKAKDRQMVQKCSALCGITIAHKNLFSYLNHVERYTEPMALNRLLDWKEERGVQFEVPITDETTAVRRTTQKIESVRVQRREEEERRSVQRDVPKTDRMHKTMKRRLGL